MSIEQNNIIFVGAVNEPQMRALETQFQRQNNLFIGSDKEPVSLELIYQNLDALLAVYEFMHPLSQLIASKGIIFAQGEKILFWYCS